MNLTLIMVELDKTRSSSTKRGGASIFSSNASDIPKELLPLVAPQQALSKLVLSKMTSAKAAAHDYEKLTDPELAVPSAPVHAARLNGLLKTLASAEGAVAESIKARKLLIDGLEKFLDTNRTALNAEEIQIAEISNRKIEIDSKKREVEEAIMRGFGSNSNSPTPVGDSSITHYDSPATSAPGPDRPEVEPLSPPVYPKATDSPTPDFDVSEKTLEPGWNDSVSAKIQALSSTLHSNLSSTASYSQPGSVVSPKKRKLNHREDFPDLGGDALEGLDDDVAAILRQDSTNCA